MQRMSALLGIDLGTSSVKAVVIDETGKLLGVGSREIPMEVPEPNRAEQDPAAWWSNTVMAVRAALHQARIHEVDAIGLDGHMHGFALLDAKHQPVGHAITWADQRTASLIPEIEAQGRRRDLPVDRRDAPRGRLHGPHDGLAAAP